MGQNGVNWVSKQWNDIDAFGGKISIIPSHEVIQSIGDILAIGNLTKNMEITGIELEYYPMESGGDTRLIPVWRCESDNGSIKIDAETGALISI